MLGIRLEYHEMSGRRQRQVSQLVGLFTLLTLPSADVLVVRKPRIKSSNLGGTVTMILNDIVRKRILSDNGTLNITIMSVV